MATKTMQPAAAAAHKSGGGGIYSRLSIRGRETLTSYLFLLPALLFFFVFVVGPICSGLFTSFFNYTDRKFEFTGLDNYIRLFQNEHFIKSLGNTILLVVGVVPVIVIFSLLVSVVIYEKNVFVRSLFRGVFYLPVVTGTVSVTVVWKWIYDPSSGILNYLLRSMNLIDGDIMWLGDKRFALLAILLVLFTTSVGQPVVLFVAALGNVDVSHIEAARIDGANEWQVFWHVKWAEIMPTTLYVVVISTINSFQCFSLIQLLTNGGPNYASSTIMFMVYETAFRQSKFGYANAMGVVLALIIGLFSFIQFRCFGSDVEY